MIQITDRAAAQIRKMLAKRNRHETGLRVGVRAGGCSGFEYTFAWDVGSRPGDAVVDGGDGALLFVDRKSLRLLDEIELDYDNNLLSRGFLITNPRAQATCGCGISFSVGEPDFSQGRDEDHS